MDIDQLNKNAADTHPLWVENIGWQTDIENIYQLCRTNLQKKELVRTVFDISLYYENRVHRTPYLIPEFAHNELIMKENGLLLINKKGDFLTKIPSSGGEGIIIEHLGSLLALVQCLKH